MSAARNLLPMTQEAFFVWAEAQNEGYEFDGFQPVAMTGGSVNHDQICQNLWAGLRSVLAGGPCRVRGPNAGMATIGNTVRYPDALITCTAVTGTARVVPGVVVVLEVVSPDNAWVDRIAKVREYFAVPSIQHYVLMEPDRVGLTLLTRGPDSWLATAMTDGDTLRLATPGIEISIAALYDGTDIPPGEQAAATAR